jgi:hypothetical protein
MARHLHKEAFCLMVYACAGAADTRPPAAGFNRMRSSGCGHREVFWNSRDGVTPFGMCCPSCGGDLFHADWQLDRPAPNHQPHYGQGVWRDGTPEEAEAIIRKRLESYPPRDDAERARVEQSIKRIKAGECTEFRPGWPMFYRNGVANV